MANLNLAEIASALDISDCESKDDAHLTRLIMERIEALHQRYRMLLQRSSPAHEPCSCPEFCSYHARSRFEVMRRETEMLREHLKAKRKVLKVVIDHIKEILQPVAEIIAHDEGLPKSCECDNTHEANGTVCRWCWEHGRRSWNDPEVEDDNGSVG